MSDPASTTTVADAARACALAEFAKWDAVLRFRDERVRALDADESLTSMYRQIAVNTIALELARLMKISETQVWRILEQGRRLRDHVPSAWAAFGQGEIDAQKASVIVHGVARAEHPETVAAIDPVVVAHAASHTPADLRRWLDKLIDRLEPVIVSEADAERAKRRVSIDHTHRGMSWVNAYLPATVAVAIRTRLRKAARQIDGDRTADQKQADLFASWLTNATGTECDIKAEVAVVVEATALAGVTDTPAYLNDSEVDVPVPPSWALGLTEADSTLWTRLLTDPRGQVLDVTQIGYQPTEALRKAVQWRDMTCRVKGCHRRADRTDLDHIEPFDEGGATSGSNLRCLCRKHHGMKGHRLLAPDDYDPPEFHVTRLPARSLKVDYIPAA